MLAQFLSAAALVLCATVFAACTDFEGITVQQALVVDANTCTVEGDPSTPQVLAPIFNVDYPGSSYMLFALVRSQLVGRQTDLNSDPFLVQASKVQVELNQGDGALLAFNGLPNPFEVAVPSFSIASATSSGPSVSPGYGTVAVTLIPSAYRAQLQAQDAVFARYRVEGETLGGSTVRSNWAQTSISLCRGGCLFTCLPEGESLDEADGCMPGQDFSKRTPCVVDPDTNQPIPSFLVQ